MSYVDFTDNQTQKIYRMYTGAVGGFVYNEEGNIDLTVSNPFLRYIGTPISKLLKGLKRNADWFSHGQNPILLSITYLPNETEQVSGNYDGSKYSDIVNAPVEAYTVRIANRDVFKVYIDPVCWHYEQDFCFCLDYNNLSKNIWICKAYGGTITGGIKYNNPSDIEIQINNQQLMPLDNNAHVVKKWDVENCRVKSLDIQSNGYYVKNIYYPQPNLDQRWLAQIYLNGNNFSLVGQQIMPFAGVWYEGNVILNTTVLRQSTNVASNFCDVISDTNPPEDDNDDTPEYGGNGDEDDSSDIIPPPTPPPVTYLGTKMMKAHIITLTQLNDLGTKLWSNNIFDQLINILAYPIDSIIGIKFFQCPLPASTNEEIIIGNISSGINAPALSVAYTTLDFGTLYVPTYYNNFIDFENTKLEIYLPYIGYQVLPNTCLGTQIQLKYNIDLISGDCVAIIYQIGEVHSVIAQFVGNCTYNLPITGRDAREYLSALVSSYGTSIFTDREYKSRGALSPNTGYLSVLTPYIKVEIAKQVEGNYNSIIGGVLFQNQTVGSMSGFAQGDIYIQNINATELEKEMITSMFKEGVFL